MVNQSVVQVLAKGIIKSDSSIRKLMGLKKPKSRFFIDSKGVVRVRKLK